MVIKKYVSSLALPMGMELTHVTFVNKAPVGGGRLLLYKLFVLLHSASDINSIRGMDKII